MITNLLFSVIIPTCHRNELLAKCLDCLAPGIQTLPVESYEVIVTDDGSETTAEQMILGKYSWARWIPGHQKGPAANRNNGARCARGEWLIFIDDDCFPDSHCLKAYADYQYETSFQILEGRTYVNIPRRSLRETSPINLTGGHLWSCNFAISKQLFLSLGGFDERFPYAAMEDVELRIRLQNQGYKIPFVPDASVCHPWRDAGGWKKLRQHQESTLIYLSIHPEEINNINWRYYLHMSLYGLLKVTLPWLARFRFAGVRYAFLEHYSYLQMAIVLLIYQLTQNHDKTYISS